MSLPWIHDAFSSGEIAPSLFGHVGLEKEQVGATTMRNCIVNYHGGAYSRAGTAFVGYSMQTGRAYPPRLITFQFSIAQGLAIEFGNLYMRVISDGAYVTNAPTNISGIVLGATTTVTDDAHGYANGTWVYLAGINGTTQLNGRIFVAANVTTNTFELTDVYGNAINSAGYSAYVSGGTASSLYTLVTPWAEADLAYLKFAQSADVMSICCWNQDSGTEYSPYDLERLADDDWALSALTTASSIAAPATVSAVAGSIASNENPTEYATAYAYVVTGVVAATGEESVASPIANVVNSVDIALTSGQITTTWSASTDADYYNVYKAPPAANSGTLGAFTTAPVPAGAIFGFLGTTYGTQFVDSNITADMSQVPQLHLNPFEPGQITSVAPTNGGSGLATVSYTINTATGSGFEGYPIIVGGSLSAFVVTNPGRNYADADTIEFDGAGFASGEIVFAARPTAGDTITLNGVIWTFVSAITGANQTLIADDLADTLVALASNLVSSSNASLVVADYAATGLDLLIQYKTAGTAGNAYTLAASVATPSAGTLEGGAGTAGAAASGTYAGTGTNPTNGQTIVLNGVAWTFVTSGATGNQTNIQGTEALTLTQLATDLTASTNASIDVANYTATATALNITYKTVGTTGNAYTLAAGTYGGTVSGPTLTGGVNGPGAPAAVLVVGPQSGTYPGVVSYFQERRVYAATPNNPDTYYMSQPGLFKNFDARIPTIASDSITGSPWSVEVNGIQFMISMPGGLVVLTGLSAWQLTGVGGSSLNPQPITPASQEAMPQAYNGCAATVPPIQIEYDVLYVQAKGSIIRDLSYNFFANIYTGTDLTILSSHLFLGYTIKQWAWTEEPFKVIWSVRNDGILLSDTYLKVEQVNGWARHDTNGLFQAVTSVTEPPVDALYTCVQRFPPAGAAYMIERMDNRIWEQAENVWAVDAGLQNEIIAPEATLSANSATGLGSIVGVTGLVGGSGYSAETTAAVIDDNGQGCGAGAVPTLTVVNGVITAIAFPGGSQGAGYTQPAIQFNDPSGSGIGASASPVLNNTATFTASAAIFSNESVGSVIRMGGGIAMINTCISATVVEAVVSQPIAQVIPNSGGAPIPQPGGNWTLTAPVAAASGLWHLVGMTVTGLADGQVIPPMAVNDNGEIPLATPASMITVGLRYTAQLQSIYLDAGQPTVQGQRKKIAAMVVRMEASRGLMSGANQADGSVQSPMVLAPTWNAATGMQIVPDKGVAPYGNLSGNFVIPAQPLYTGDVRVPTPGGFAVQGQVAMQQSNPLPLQVTALVVEALGGDTPQNAVAPRQDNRQQRRAA